jgi:hypothetical protein
VDWIAPVGSGLVALAGLAFGWASTVRSQRQTAELAREGNRHAQALAELAGEQARRLEQVRHQQGVRDRWDRRLEDSYVEVATTVIRLSTTVSEAGETEPDALVRARVLVGLFADGAVREAFDKWLDRFDRLRYALGRQAEADGSAAPVSTRDLHSTKDMWRRQATDARLKEIDVRERLIGAMAASLGRPLPDPPPPAPSPGEPGPA